MRDPSALKSPRYPGNVNTSRWACRARCRTCSASGRTVPSTRYVVSTASRARSMLRSVSTSRFATAAAASSRAIATLASRSACRPRSAATRARLVATSAPTVSTATNARSRTTERRFNEASWARCCSSARCSVSRWRRLVVRYSRSTAPSAMSDWVAHPSYCASREPRNRKLGSRPPSSQSLPAIEQRLMGDLDRRLPGHRVPVRREKPVMLEPVDRGRHRAGVDLDGFELGAPNPAPNGLEALLHVHQAKEQLPGRLLPRLFTARIEVLRATCQRAAQPTQLAIVGEGKDPVPPSLEDLGECVLQQG